MVTSSNPSDGVSAPRLNDLPALTGMRYIAALLVFITHLAVPFMSFDPAAVPPVPPFRDEGVMNGVYIFITGTGMAMPFFFMLSGFVLTWSAGRKLRARGFWRRRLVRIFPNHAVTWVLTMVLYAAVFTPAAGLTHLFLVNTWSTNPSYWLGANSQAWSLCAELLFYLFFPLLLVWVRRIADDRLWWWAGAMVAGMLAVCLVAVYLMPEGSLLQFWFVYFFPPSRLFESVLGMLIARIVQSGRWPKIGFTPVVALLVVTYLGMVFTPMPYNLTLVPAIPLALLIGTFAAANVRGRRTVMGTKPMVWLGNLSYGFYMIQGVVLYWLRPRILGTQQFDVPTGIALFVGFIALNTFLGWVLMKTVEQPMMRRWSRSRKAPARIPDNGHSAGGPQPTERGSSQPADRPTAARVDQPAKDLGAP
ncbi:acyltransferase family protein [Actinosynnema sp. CS-041913]|uniref:acyltransferase family protein n=1 Tax=Actinosynnema sp. CS-041913 TaxID=3239917 RepID=UPI003D921950